MPHDQRHPDDYPRSMRDPGVRQRRRAMLDRLHVAPLVEYVEELESMGRGEVPMPDPLGPGVNARLLCLYQNPGPKAAASGFLSLSNDDPTAEKTSMFLDEVGLPRAKFFPWNIVPWWRERNITGEERRAGIECLPGLLDLLPHLRGVLLVGRQAQRARKVFQARALEVFESYHPSPLVRARYPEKWRAIPEQWKKAVACLS